MGEIYKICNDINNKIYIGKTVKSAKYRYNTHLYDINDGTAIHNAMKKYGLEHFYVEVIESNILNKKDLAEKEKYYIAKYQSIVPNGYNITSGGEGGNGTHAKNLQDWRKNNPDLVQKNIEQLQSWRQQHPEEVKEANKKATNTRKEKYGNNITKAAREKNKKRVKCIETGIIYDSASEAAKSLNKTSGAHIGQVCNGKRLTAFNYHWEWV